MHPIAQATLVILQCFAALFVALHNWVPLGTLNDVKAVRAEFPGWKLLFTTLLNFMPVAFGLVASVIYLGRPYPGWLFWWLGIFYAIACFGSLREWWIPYLSQPSPEHVARYRAMHGATHSFLPERHGIRPNTLHLIFDGITVAILITLGVLAAQS